MHVGRAPFVSLLSTPNITAMFIIELNHKLLIVAAHLYIHNSPSNITHTAPLIYIKRPSFDVS